MKKLLTLLLLTPLFVKAQRDTLRAGVALDGYLTNNGYYVCFYPHLFAESGKHALGAGPAFTMLPDAYSGEANATKLTGARVFYKFRPVPAGRHFVFYFRYDLIGHAYRTMFYKFVSSDNSIENYVGYGFNLSIGRRFFIAQHLGIGLQYISRSYKDPNGTLSRSEDWEEGVIGGVGVGMRF